MGKKASYQGVIELWHVETFEGGAMSRSRWLEKKAQEFEKENKGLFILVKNMTLSELENNLDNNIMPDLFSFSTGSQNKIKQFLSELEDSKFSHLRPELKMSSSFKNELLAVPFCYSGYCLLSTKEKLSKIGDIKNLKDVLFSTGYVKKLRKGEKNIYSCVYGGGSLSSPKTIINSLNKSDNSLAIHPKSNQLTSYQAYCSFFENEANILVGTMRDLIRFENKLNSGLVENLICEGFSNFTDMVCYLGCCKGKNEKILNISHQFIEFCLSKKVQKSVAQLGLMSPVYNDLYKDDFKNIIEKTYSDKIECLPLFE